MLLHAGLRPAAVAPLPVRQRMRVANLSAGARRFRRGSTPLRPAPAVVGRRAVCHVVSAELSDKGRRFRAADVEVPGVHPERKPLPGVHRNLGSSLQSEWQH